jgi:hypothetical protein
MQLYFPLFMLAPITPPRIMKIQSIRRSPPIWTHHTSFKRGELDESNSIEIIIGIEELEALFEEYNLLLPQAYL